MSGVASEPGMADMPPRGPAGPFTYQEPAAVPNPGKYEELNKEAKMILNPDIFDGFRFELHKPLSPKFQLRHFVWLGSQQVAGGHYEFGSTFANENTLLMGSMDHAHRLNARFQYQPMKNVAVRAMAQVAAADPASGMDPTGGTVDVDLNGSTFQGNLKLASSGMMSASWLQSLTKSIAVGAEVQRGQGQVAFSGCARYNAASSISTLQLYSFGLAAASYVHRLGDRAAVSTELVYVPSQKNESSVSVGYMYAFNTGCTLKGVVSNNWKVQSLMERRINPAISLNISAELDHSKKNGDQKFGLGFTIGQ